MPCRRKGGEAATKLSGVGLGEKWKNAFVARLLAKQYTIRISCHGDRTRLLVQCLSIVHFPIWRKFTLKQKLHVVICSTKQKNLELVIHHLVERRQGNSGRGDVMNGAERPPAMTGQFRKLTTKHHGIVWKGLHFPCFFMSQNFSTVDGEKWVVKIHKQKNCYQYEIDVRHPHCVACIRPELKLKRRDEQWAHWAGEQQS